jgi:hypothetical protein
MLIIIAILLVCFALGEPHISSTALAQDLDEFEVRYRL